MTEEAPKAGFAENFATKYQYLMDKSSPLVLYRWIGMAVSMALYMARVYYINGFFIVTYGLGIYLLNQLIGFISPQFDPEESESDLTLPTSNNEEFR
mmetsp:Transcript_9988/g.21818  ORF Transcript_9988/g.21818 Transcript_9988/m.21818 type:complete len:97 (+) Transcript_9988:167-457(+)